MKAITHGWNDTSYDGAEVREPARVHVLVIIASLGLMAFCSAMMAYAHAAAGPSAGTTHAATPPAALRWVPRLSSQVSDTARVSCLDVRSGTLFPVPAIAVTSAGELIADTTALSRLCVGTSKGVHAVAVTDGAGGAYVAWVEPAGESCDLRLLRVSATGARAAGWPEGGALACSAPGTQAHPALLANESFGVWLAWQDHRDRLRPRVQVAYYDAGGTPSGLAADGGARVRVSAEPQVEPRMVARGPGLAVVLWTEGTPGGRNVLAADLDPSLAALVGSDRLIAGSSDDELLRAADARTGIAPAIVLESRAGTTRRLRVLGLSPNVTSIAWTREVATAGDAETELRSGALRVDSLGVVASWSVAAGDSSQSRLLSLGASGSPAAGWPADGIRLGAGHGFVSEASSIVHGADGRIFAAWVGQDAADPATTFASCVNASGASVTGWAPSGVQLGRAPGEHYAARLVTATDGVLATWASASGGGSGTMLRSGEVLTGALPEVVETRVWPDLLRLVLRVPESAAYQVVAERRTERGEWVALTAGAADASTVTLETRGANPGRTTLRLRLLTEALEALMPEWEVDIPGPPPLTLSRVWIADGTLHASVALPNSSAPRLELFDVQGRRLLRREFRVEHAGEQELMWSGGGGLRSGIYFARLTQERTARVRRVVLSR